MRFLSAVLFSALFSGAVFAQVGGIRGVVMDTDFEVPLPGVKVRVSETGQETVTGDTGSYYLEKIEPGAYTVLFSKSGYSRFTKSDVVVSPGQLADVEASLAGEYEEMDELVVKEISLGGASEIGLLNLRLDSIGMMDAVGADMMSKAGASDVAGALKLVTGATVVDGKYASVRGLSDRYVGAGLNGIRVPSADPKRRAVQMDVFPAGTIESVTVYKNFTPDLPGDYTGGGVDIKTKSIPDEPFLSFSVKGEYNTESTGNDDFVTYEGGGANFWGSHDGERDMAPGMAEMEQNGLLSSASSEWDVIADGANPHDAEHQELDRIVRSVDPVMGVTREAPGPNWGFSLGAGGKLDLGNSVRVGGSAAFSYDNKFKYREAEEQKYEKANLSNPANSVIDRYNSDTGTEEVKWSALGNIGVQFGDNHEIGVVGLHNQVATDSAQYKELVQEPGTDFIRQDQSIQYIERSLDVLQFTGRHEVEELFSPRLGMEFDWFYALNRAEQDEPDVRNFNNYVYDEGGGTNRFQQLAEGSSGSAENQTSRAWRNTVEDNDQLGANLKFPFELPAFDLHGLFSGDGSSFSDREGGLKFGFVADETEREFRQNTFYYDFSQQTKPSGEPNADDYATIDFGPPPQIIFDEAAYNADLAAWNAQDNVAAYNAARELGTFRTGDPNQLWTDVFTDEDRIGTGEYQNSMLWQLLPKVRDVDYDGEQDILAYYGMLEFPVTAQMTLIGGARYEDTDLTIDPYSDYENIDPSRAYNYAKRNFVGSDGGYYYTIDSTNRAGASADLQQDDVLPSIGLVYDFTDQIKLRLNYAETIARPTFLELAPIITTDFIEDETTIGNKDLAISSVKNYDARMEYFPAPGRMVAFSVFQKDIKDPIDKETFGYLGNDYILAVNYDEGEVFGFEVEARSSFDILHESLSDFSAGINFTKIDATVKVPDALNSNLSNYGLDSDERAMEGQPEYLFNVNLSYDNERSGTSMGLFYNLRGEMLKAGASVGTGNGGDEVATPSIFVSELGILNFTLSQRLSEHWKVKFSAKNLLNPVVEEFYRDTNQDLTRRKYETGRAFSVGLSSTW